MPAASTPRLNLIAHRGYPTKYPENTIVGYRAAIEAGATWIETDIQLTRDLCPVLYHDVDLRRLSDHRGRILEQSSAELSERRANFPSRFSNRFADEPIATLDQFVKLIRNYPMVQAMVELKPQSIDRFGAESVLGVVHERLWELANQCVLISLDPLVVERARARHGWRIGWVLSQWDDEARRTAERLRPDFLFGSTEQLRTRGELAEGPWNWAIYCIDDPQLAVAQITRGIAYVETDSIGEMLQDERLIRLCQATRDSIS